MKQSWFHSHGETLAQNIVGQILAYCILRLWHIPQGTGLGLQVTFFLVAYARGVVIRRIFNSMRQSMANNCYDKAEEGEPSFTLLARDYSTPHVVRSWAYGREREIATGFNPESDRVKVESARKLADDMEYWRKRYRPTNPTEMEKPQVSKE